MAEIFEQNDFPARGADSAESGSNRVGPSDWRSVERSGIVRSEPLPARAAPAVQTQLSDYAAALARWEDEGGAPREGRVRPRMM